MHMAAAPPTVCKMIFTLKGFCHLLYLLHKFSSPREAAIHNQQWGGSGETFYGMVGQSTKEVQWPLLKGTPTYHPTYYFNHTRILVNVHLY